MKNNIRSDLSTLTTIKESAINKLFDLIPWCISDTIERTIYNNESTAEIDLGFGNILINIMDNEVKYKFIPSKELEKSIIDTIVNEKNNLVLSIESSLVKKIMEIYKELL